MLSPNPQRRSQVKLFLSCFKLFSVPPKLPLMLCHRNKRNEIHATSDLWISSFLFQVSKFQVDKFFANWALRKLSGWNSRRSSVLPWNLQVICGSGHSLNKCLSVWARSTRIRSRLWGGEQETLFAFCTPNGQDHNIWSDESTFRNIQHPTKISN